MNITFLGTGTSHGVPSIDCMMSGFERCPRGVCRRSATDPKHARTRCSILVEHSGKRVLIDVSADFRQQVLRERIASIDAVLITHKHADHISGVPDIRSYTKDPANPLPFYGSPESMSALREMYDYIFNPATIVGGGIPRIGLTGITDPFDLFGMRIVPVKVTHGGAKGCYGFRLGPLAYVPDMKAIAEDQKQLLKGLDCLILNCLRIEREHSTHLVLPQSMALARELAPRRCFFVHMSHDIDYEADSRLLDPWMQFAYDGMKIDVAD